MKKKHNRDCPNIFETNFPVDFSDSGNRLLYLISFCRSILQHAAINAYEYALDFCSDYEEIVTENINCLLNFNDGDIIRSIDTILPIIRQSGWEGCTTWFERISSDSNINGETLVNISQKWCTWRNNRPGHGVVSEKDISDALIWIEPFSRELVRGLNDLLPKKAPSNDTLMLNTPNGDFYIKTIRLVNGRAILIRSIQIRGDKWRVKYQILDQFQSEEGYYLIDNLPLCLSPQTHLFTARVVNDSSWRPDVCIPRKITENFTGRKRELTELQNWYNDTDSRACLVYGEGGIGKTTLVLEFLNSILDGCETNLNWYPHVIVFYSAKQTRWGPNGLEYLKGMPPLVLEAVRLLARLIENPLDKTWYSNDWKSVIDKTANLYAALGMNKEDVLIVIDNTESFARAVDDESDIDRVLSYIRKRLGRLIITSRRHAKIEAFPLEILSIDNSSGIKLLKRLAIEYNSRSILNTDDRKLSKCVEKFHGRPLLLETLVHIACQKSFDQAENLLLKAAQKDLGEFLFRDAWRRMSPTQRDVFFILSRLGGTVDSQVVSWTCAAVSEAHSVWLDAFEETRFGSLRDYGDKYDLTLDLSAKEFIDNEYLRLDIYASEKLSEAEEIVKKRAQDFAYAAGIQIKDRLSNAFRSEAAKAARHAADRGDYEEAEIWYEEAISIDNQNYDLFDRFAYFLFRKAKSLVRAKAISKRACELGVDEPETFFTYGMICSELGELTDADIAFERSESLGKESHLCALQRAKAHTIYLTKNLTQIRRDRKRSHEILDIAFKHLSKAEKNSSKSSMTARMLNKHAIECERIDNRLQGLARSLQRRSSPTKSWYETSP